MALWLARVMLEAGVPADAVMVITGIATRSWMRCSPIARSTRHAAGWAATTRLTAVQRWPLFRVAPEEFRRGPYASDAVRLRRYDDLAKAPGRVTPPLDHYRAVLEAVMTG